MLRRLVQQFINKEELSKDYPSDSDSDSPSYYPNDSDSDFSSSDSEMSSSDSEMPSSPLSDGDTSSPYPRDSDLSSPHPRDSDLSSSELSGSNTSSSELSGSNTSSSDLEDSTVDKTKTLDDKIEATDMAPKKLSVSEPIQEAGVVDNTQVVPEGVNASMVEAIPEVSSTSGSGFGIELTQASYSTSGSGFGIELTQTSYSTSGSGFGIELTQTGDWVVPACSDLSFSWPCVVFCIYGGVSAVMVISAVRPVYAVLWLISAFLSVSAIFILLGLVFMGFIMIIVYVGAIAILFLFVMMMLDQGKEEAGTPIANFIPMGLIVGVAFLWVAASGGEWGWGAADISLQNHSWGMIGGLPGGDIEAIGRVLYTDYSYMFIIVSYILLVAMVGAIVLTHRHGEYGTDEPLRQDIFIQTSREIWGHPNPSTRESKQPEFFRYL